MVHCVDAYTSGLIGQLHDSPAAAVSRNLARRVQLLLLRSSRVVEYHSYRFLDLLTLDHHYSSLLQNRTVADHEESRGGVHSQNTGAPEMRAVPTFSSRKSCIFRLLSKHLN